MHNPFANPQTLGQWLLSSVCWVMSCLAGFCGSVYGVSVFLPHSGDLDGWVIFGGAIAVCLLMWRRVIAIGWQLRLAGPAWLVVCGGLWRLLLTLLLILSVVLIGVGLFIVLAFTMSPDSTSSF